MATPSDEALHPRIDRPRLRALLDDASAAPLVVVRAPAGYGKTALVESWATARAGAGSLVWESLRRRDTNTYRFWKRFVVGIKRSTDARTARRLSRFRLSQDGLTEDLASTLAQILLGATDPLVIVLDDFEFISKPQLLAQLDGLISRLTPRVRIIVSTRTEPGLPLHRMMVEGKATRIGVEDLVFTRDEAAELLGAHGVELADKHMDIVMERTQGWPAGLRLLGIALERHLSPEDFVAAFNGEDTSVRDYISEEIFGPLDDEMKLFILKTCVVDQLTGEIARSLSGRDDAEVMLAKLSRSNALVDDVNHNGLVFRFHPMFADFLRSELHKTDPALANEQRRKAAELSGAAGGFEGVLAQAIAAGDARLADDFLTVGSFLDLFGSSEVVIDSRLWHLPHLEPDGEPLLILVDAARSLAVGDMDGSTIRLAEAAQSLEVDTTSDTCRASLVFTICQAIHGALSGDGKRMLATVDQLDALSERATKEGLISVSDLRSIIESLRGASVLAEGRWNEAEPLLTSGLVSARRARRPFFELLCISLLAAAAAGRGRPSLARDRGHEALGLAAEYGLLRSPTLVGAHLALAWAAYQRDELDQAEASLGRARRSQGAFQKSPPFAVAVALLGAAIARGRGDVDTGLAMLEAALEVGDEWSPFQEQLLSFLRADVLLASGKTEAAADSIDGRSPESLSESGTVAHVRLAQGNPAFAIEVLERALTAPDPDDVVGQVQCWCLKARALDVSGDQRAAALSLERALVLAEPEGVTRVFLDQGREMKELLHNMLRFTNGPHRFARGLLEKLTGPTSLQPVDSALIDPLTERELHVLRYLPSLLSAGEIAAELYVSLNTVKTHLRSIYRKLGVSTRRGAVDRATELGIF